MRWDKLCALARELPEVVEDSWYGTPGLKVRGKGFVRLKEDRRSVVFLLPSVDEQEILIQAMPEIYYITDHYKGWPSVLARLDKLRVPEARERLEQSWRRKAPTALVKKRDAGALTPEPPRARATARTARRRGGARRRARR